MESEGFLLKFYELASGNETLITSAVEFIKQTLHQSKGEVTTILGKLTPDLKYTLDRLLKGLTGGKPAKIGFATALTTLLQYFTLDTEKLFDYFLSLDHSGISAFQITVAQVLLYTCILRASKPVSRILTEKVMEAFKGKSSLKEVAAVALASDPNRKKLAKELQMVQDANGFVISYSGISDESVMTQCSRHKEIILKGSFKVLPRLHHVWKCVIKSARALGKEYFVWDLFVEKTLKTEDKKRAKRIGLAFVLFKAFLDAGCRPSDLLTTEFWNVWQDNLFSKKLRDHSVAMELKTMLLADIVSRKNDPELLSRLFELLSSVKTLDFIKTCFETLVSVSDKRIKKQLVKEFIKFNTGKKANFSINLLYFIAKNTPELQKLCVKKLLRYGVSDDTVAEAARVKVLNLASDLNLYDTILGFFRKDSESAAVILNKLATTETWEIKSSEDTLGKRKPGDLSLVTQAQLANLIKVLKMLALEGILYHNSGDFEEFLKIVKKIVRNKAKDFDELCYFLLSSLTKPVGYMRNCVGKVFKGFVNEVSEKFLTQICRIVETGEFSIETGEVKVEEETQDGEILNEETGEKKQEKGVKDSFLARATEFLEIVVKKSENVKDKLKVYMTLLSAMRAASRTSDKSHLVHRFLAILGKVHKKEIKITEEELESVKSILFSCFKSVMLNKSFGNFLSKNISALLKLILTVNAEEAERIFTEFIGKYFEKHSCSLKIENFIQILMNFTESPDIWKKILGYVEKGRSPSTQLQAAEVLKALTKKAANAKMIGKLIKVIKTVEKCEFKLKIKNKIQKNLLCAILAVSKKFPPQAEVVEALDDLQKSLLSRSYFHGLFIQIKSPS